jgi:hypothetical protein
VPQQVGKGLLERVQIEQDQRGAAVAACTDHATVAHELGKWCQALSPSVAVDSAPGTLRAPLSPAVISSFVAKRQIAPAREGKASDDRQTDNG